MIRTARAIPLIILLLTSPVTFAATAIAVPAPEGADNRMPTYTLLYGVENPQITLVVVLGGGGRVGLNESSTDTRNQTAQMARLLAQSEFSDVRVNVVIFDSPYDLAPGMRTDMEHLNRIASVVRFYRQQFPIPVWLLGHSYGTVSVTQYLKKKYAETPVAAAIVSGGINYISFDDNLNLPMLFLHHEGDECRQTTFNSAQSHYEDVKKSNKSDVALMVVRGGSSRGDPCRDGKHMYFGAYAEAAGLIADFIRKNFR